MKRSDTIRVIPAEFEKLIRMRELVIAEGKRRKEEEEAKGKSGVEGGIRT